MIEQSNCLVLENNALQEAALNAQEYNEILNMQQIILEMIAERVHSNSILDKLCQLAESLLPNAVASIMILNESTGLMSVLRAPSIPQVGHERLENLKPGPHGGSCGNAVFHNEAQFVGDTFNDSRWQDIRQVAYDFNLCSCWSMPIRNDKKEAKGSFALSSFEHRLPSNFHKKILETAANIVNIVLRNANDDNRINIFGAALENAKEGMIISNAKNEILEVNASFEKIYGYQEADVLGKNPNIFASGEHDQAFYDAMWSSLQKEAYWNGTIINKKADGSLIEQWMSISKIEDPLHNIQSYLAVFTDMTELNKAQSRAHYLAFHDELTQLENKAQLEIHLGSSQDSQWILHLDINNFNYINTSYGFSFGDKLLQSIAKTLQKAFDATNVYRVNSDEFVLLFDAQSDIKAKISSIQNYFYINSIVVDGVYNNVTFNYGASMSDENLLKHAASALALSKELGKNRYHIYDSDDDISNKAIKEFIDANKLLYSALKNNHVEVFFQGIHNNSKNIIDKNEVLVRIVDGDIVISPYYFLDAAKLSGLLPDITKIVIDKSFNIMQSREDTFSINITEDDLSRNYLVAYFEEKLLEYNIAPSRVILEILEGVSATGKKNHISQLNTLKQKGFALAIDDFGAEYSNFERVMDLDIDFLKIDAKYIKNIDTDKKSYEITKAIAYFARNANIPCIAEFVHSEGVQKVVQELGIDYSQGYYFSEPQPLN